MYLGLPTSSFKVSTTTPFSPKLSEYPIKADLKSFTCLDIMRLSINIDRGICKTIKHD